jgi:phosphohistidine phosphatase
MLTLTLIRHAKSSWADPSLPDFTRPLAPRGFAAGAVMASWLAVNVRPPDTVLVSSALRTQATWALLADAWGAPATCTLDDSLYMAVSERVLRQIGKTPATTAHLMIVGHNPGMQDLALALIGPASTTERMALVAKFPTAAVAVLTFDTRLWSDVRAGQGHLQHFVSPRRLAGAS